MSAFKDLSGQVFGRLTVICRTEQPTKTKKPETFWLCKCQCGKDTTLRTNNLQSGGTISCGCYQKEVITKHSACFTDQYRIWAGMKRRCKSHKNYAGKGIEVCERWKESYLNFLEDMGPRPSPNHSVDRIKNNKGYSKDNCRWATPTEQQRNRTNNHLITYKGVTSPVSAWAEEFGLKTQLICKRLKIGWSVEKALTTPVLGWDQAVAKSLRHNRHTKKKVGLILSCND